MKTITKVDPLTTGKVFAVTLGLWQLIVGILLLLQIPKLLPPQFATLMGLSLPQEPVDFFQVLLVAVFTLIIGFVLGLVLAVLYNVVASWVGGIKLDLE